MLRNRDIKLNVSFIVFSIKNDPPDATLENNVEVKANNSNDVACKVVNDVASEDEVPAQLGADFLYLYILNFYVHDLCPIKLVLIPDVFTYYVDVYFIKKKLHLNIIL